MSRKAFLIWGLVIIQFNVTLYAVATYLAFSNVIDAKAVGLPLDIVTILVVLIGFFSILFLRFKKIGRRTRVLILLAPFYIFTATASTWLTLPYHDFIVANSGAQDRFSYAIYEFSKLEGQDQSAVWTVREKIDYILILMPAHYFGNWGLFALLWFGSLDPRSPSQNKAVTFIKAKLSGEPRGFSAHNAKLNSAT